MEETSGTDGSVRQEAPAAALPMRSFGEVSGFNGLRGIALLIVFVAHMDVILPIPTLLVIPGATVSLDSFFVLSGFLITALLLREQARYGGIGIGPFYRRRALRLLPALYVVVLANALFAYFSHEWLHTEWPSIFSVLFYYSNYYSASASGPLSPKLASGFQHLWSLSFEEQFYLVWPWLTIMLLTIRMRLRTVAIVLLSMIAVIAVHRYISYEETHRWWSLFYRTDTRADSILWGALLAHVWIRRKEPKRGLAVAGWLSAAFLIACLPFATQEGPFVYWGGFVAIDIACVFLILAILDGRWLGSRFFEFKPLVALGVVSYAFYLWHLPVFFAIRHFDTHWSDVLRVVVATVVTLSLTIASWFLLERPLVRWGKRLETRRHERLKSRRRAVSGHCDPGRGRRPGRLGHRLTVARQDPPSPRRGDDTGGSQPEDRQPAEDEADRERGGPVVQGHRVASGRDVQLEHHRREAPERHRPAVDAGVPSGDVGQAQAHHLWAVCVRDDPPGRGVRVGHPQGSPRRVIGREPIARAEWCRSRRSGSGNAIEVLVPHGVDECASPRSRRAGSL